MTIIKFIWRDKSRFSKGAFEIVKTLRKAGHEALVAGGAVRDALLKREVKEIDIATSATPNHVKKMFAKTIPTGEKHGTITVFPPHPPLSRQGRGMKGKGYEVTTFRKEGKYLDARHPSKVTFLKKAEDDARRRDFTINSLFYDPEQKEIIDYVSGISDLYHERLRLVGDPEKRIREDALRMMRAARFAAALKFEIEKETRKAIQNRAQLIKKVSAERIKRELDLIMLSGRASVGIGMLDYLGLLDHILPEIKNLKGVRQPKNQHSEGDVYAHTMLALEKIDESFDLPTRYAVLLHDIAKPQTAEVRDGKITFYNHTTLGEEIAEKIMKRLKAAKHETEKITWLVRTHLVPADFVKMKLSTRRKWGLHPYFKDMLKVFLADTRASIPSSGKVNTNPQGYREGQKILKEIEKQPQLAKQIISGRDVMKILKIKPGPSVGKILKLVEEKKLAGKLKTKKDAEKFVSSLDKKLYTP